MYIKKNSKRDFFFTVLDLQGLPQVLQTRLRTASVDSENLEWDVRSACSWASCTDLRWAPQSPHFRDKPAIGEISRSIERKMRFHRTKPFSLLFFPSSSSCCCFLGFRYFEKEQGVLLFYYFLAEFYRSPYLVF